MLVTEVPVDHISPPTWNPNELDPAMHARLLTSIRRFGLVAPLVIRSVGPGRYETIGGAHRLQVARDLGLVTVPCVMVEADDTEARLLAQALNRIHGEDDPALRMEALHDILGSVPAEEVLRVLPETAASLAGLATLGQTDMAAHLRAWELAQGARLRTLQFHLTNAQLEVVEEALELVWAGAVGDGSNPNRRSNALFILCKDYLEQEHSA